MHNFPSVRFFVVCFWHSGCENAPGWFAGTLSIGILSSTNACSSPCYILWLLNTHWGRLYSEYTYALQFESPEWIHGHHTVPAGVGCVPCVRTDIDGSRICQAREINPLISISWYLCGLRVVRLALTSTYMKELTVCCYLLLHL